MEGELIFLGFVMLIGQIILLQMWNNNWFKKENFKMQRDIVKSENKLKLKKLEREMGLAKGSSEIKEKPTVIDNLGGVLNLVKGLDPEQISALADRFIGSEEEGGGSPIDGLLEFAEKNPEVVKNFLDGLGSTKQPPSDSAY
jgi:hypothetical protein